MNSTPGEKPMSGIELIQAERQRQIEAEGWTPEHDDQHASHELALAASCYLIPARRFANWPWSEAEWKPCSRIRQLVKAGALIAAEIDRLQRMPAAHNADGTTQIMEGVEVVTKGQNTAIEVDWSKVESI